MDKYDGVLSSMSEKDAAIITEEWERVASVWAKRNKAIEAELTECQQQRDRLAEACIDFLEAVEELGIEIDYMGVVENIKAALAELDE